VAASGSDPEGALLSYDWDLDGDGVFETPGQSVTFSARGINAPATRTAIVRVTDDSGNTAIDAVDVSVIWSFAGFLRPVDNLPVRNRVHAGLVVPMRFRLGGNQGLNVLAQGYPRVVPVNCAASTPETIVDEAAAANSPLGLLYNPLTGVYWFVWKTDKAWAGSCRQLHIKLLDGTDHVAEFRFVR